MITDETIGTKCIEDEEYSFIYMVYNLTQLTAHFIKILANPFQELAWQNLYCSKIASRSLGLFGAIQPFKQNGT